MLLVSKLVLCVFLQSGDMRTSMKDGLEHPRHFNGTDKDGSRDYSTSQDNTDRGNMSDQAFEYSASSVESLPSASGSSEYHFIFEY